MVCYGLLFVMATGSLAGCGGLPIVAHVYVCVYIYIYTSNIYKYIHLYICICIILSDNPVLIGARYHG